MGGGGSGEGGAQGTTAGDALQTLLSAHIDATDYQAVLHVIQRQITTFPNGSSSGGFVYTFDPNLGIPVRRTQSFGPVFAERPLTLGLHRFTFNISAQQTDWQAIGGQRLADGLATVSISIPSLLASTALDEDFASQHVLDNTTLTTLRFTTRRTLVGVITASPSAWTWASWCRTARPTCPARRDTSRTISPPPISWSPRAGRTARIPPCAAGRRGSATWRCAGNSRCCRAARWTWRRPPTCGCPPAMRTSCWGPAPRK